MNLNTYLTQFINYIPRKLHFLILVQLLSFSLIAQDNNKIACEHANKLKNGTLIIVLETQAKRLALIERLSKKPGTTEKDKEKYHKLLSTELAYRDTAWNYTILGFTELYKFSNVAFIMDTSLRVFLDHPENCKYYDRNLMQITSNLKGSIYVAQYGHIFENQSTSLTDAWYVMDSKLKRLAQPFPEQIKFSFFNPSFSYKLPKAFLLENHISGVKAKHKPLVYAFKLNKLLNKFYNKSGKCSD